jgi:AcrR family transcriptional regulator
MPTRDRILAAAVEEFAAHGFAGARIDGIAAAAGANKERIYANFTDKEGLFRAVMASVASDASTWLPTSGRELPQAVGDLFDASFANPALLRLLAWRRLEQPSRGGGGGGGDDGDDESSAIAQKLDDIREAQAAGIIDGSWRPEDLLAVVAALAGAWANAPAALTSLAEAEGEPVRDRRAVVEEALRRILRAG